MLRPAKKRDLPKAPVVEEGDEPDAEPAEAPPRVLSEAQERQKRQLLSSAEDFDRKLQSVESQMVSPALRNSDDKYFIEPYGAYLDLVWLNAEVGTGGGDVAGSADFAPTETQVGLLKSLEAAVASFDSDYRKILQDELPQLNRVLESANLAPLVGGAR
jgi:hypothetical protein